MCGDYIGEDDDGRARMRIDVRDKTLLSKLKAGQKATFKVEGEVAEIVAPRMVRDYDAPYPKDGGKRKLKEQPGRVVLRLDKKDPEIGLLAINKALMSEEG